MSSLEQKIQQLPLNLQQEVMRFIDKLLARNGSNRKKQPTLSWIGGLREYRDKYTALELQKKALHWRAG